MNSAVNCYSFPANTSFLHSLARWVLSNYDTLSYTKILILLPNRRSCRSLREAFLDCSGGKPLLLPRIQPIGETQEEEFWGGIDGINTYMSQPINPVRRHFLLMRLIIGFGHKNIGMISMNQAAELARQLIKFMDEVNREGLSYDKLNNLAPENLASHWQQTLEFLGIISKQWPRLLEEEGTIDAVVYRNQLLYNLSKMWEKSPPDYPVIAAGSTGSQPATANLLKTIAGLPNGKVILPFLDKEMQEDEWKEVTQTHPQYVLKQLLEKMGIERRQVGIISHCESNEAIQSYQTSEWIATSATPPRNDIDKQKYLRAIFSPPATTTNWSKIELPDPECLDYIRLIEADTLFDEARAIAIAMREVLETPAKTAALVTPDRTLARMVSVQLKRFGVMVDDSAGKPLASSPPACFLRLIVEMIASRFAPATLLAVLRHPLAAAGMNPARCRFLSRELELLLLRGIRREDGIAGLRRAAIIHKKTSKELLDLLENLEKESESFLSLMRQHHNAALQQLLSAHIGFAEWMAGSDTESGTQRLWAGEDGNTLAEIVAQWNLQAELLPVVEAMTYPALFDSLLAAEIYHSQFGLHPRLHILSPMEARLQRYDLVILGSLNEGMWPNSSPPDPWMSRPQRAAFGLPSEERAVGQSAHDFVMQLFAPEVLITRARKVEGTPAIASRWWVRLQTLIGGRMPEIFAGMNDDDYFLAAKNILEQPVSLPPISAPAPTPPFSARPRELRVTAIDPLLNNPYSIYARYILNLRSLDDIDREPDAADFGNIVHKALEKFTRSFPDNMPDEPYEKLLACGREAFADFIDRPAVACLWWPRFMSMATWFIAEEEKRRGFIESVHSEVNGRWDFAVAGKDFSLKTRIDRLEKLPSGGYNLIDYKTGIVPKTGLSNQLPLEALIVRYGKLSGDVPPGMAEQMEYWKLSGSEGKCEITNSKADIEETRKMLEELITKFDDETTPYNAQSEGLPARYNDYEHLTRRKEWEGG